MKKIAFISTSIKFGRYSNMPFETLYAGIGHNNGNLAFLYAIASQIQGSITYLDWSTPADTLNKYDVIVIPCANQFGSHTELSDLAAILQKVDKPIVAIALGAQAESFDLDVQVSDGTLAWVKAIDARRHGAIANIYTRGPFSSVQLAKHGITETVVGGCPSHFIMHNPKLGELLERKWAKIKTPRNLSVAGGHESWIKSRAVEQQLISMMMDPNAIGQYVVQSMGDMIKISRGELDSIEPAILQQIRDHTVPHYTLDEFRAWCDNYARSFYDVPAWMDSLRRFDLSVGPRYHGIQLAIQGGNMGLVVTIDSRTAELCMQTGVPHVSHEELEKVPLTRSRLKQLVKFNGAEYDAFRKERARNYVNFLEGNGLEVKPFLHKIAE